MRSAVFLWRSACGQPVGPLDAVMAKRHEGGASMHQAYSHILLVDDDPDLLLVLQLHFEDQGYAVTSVCEGREALEFLHTTPTAQVVLLDAVMPRMDGEHLLEIIAQQPRLVQRHRYVVMTGWNTSCEVLGEPLLASIGAQIIHAPFDLNHLDTTVARLSHQLLPLAAQPPSDAFW
jgi:CheY-like chemotaxis protein